MTADAEKALDDLIQLGVDRVLTRYTFEIFISLHHCPFLSSSKHSAS
jgi:hypothetical protein